MRVLGEHYLRNTGFLCLPPSLSQLSDYQIKSVRPFWFQQFFYTWRQSYCSYGSKYLDIEQMSQSRGHNNLCTLYDFKVFLLPYGWILTNG